MGDEARVDMGGVERDVQTLHDVLEGGRGGGETRLVEVVVGGNVDHLREVVRWYKHMYGKDVSKLVIRHSKNLVVSTPPFFGFSPSSLRGRC